MIQPVPMMCPNWVKYTYVIAHATFDTAHGPGIHRTDVTLITWWTPLSPFATVDLAAITVGQGVSMLTVRLVSSCNNMALVQCKDS